MEVLLTALGGETAGARSTTRSGARSTPASACWRTAGTAIVEVAQESGLGLVAEDERDAEAASSAGPAS